MSSSTLTDSALNGEFAVGPAARTEPQDLYLEYLALTQSAGILKLPQFGVLRAEGRDREAWLHRLTTADIQTLPENAGTYALLLNASAHVVADFVLFKHADALWLYSSLSAIDKLQAYLRRLIFRERVSLANASSAWLLLSIQGPKAEQVLTACFGDLRAQAAFEVTARDCNGSSVLIIKNARATARGFDLILPTESSELFWETALARGAAPAGLQALNIARVEAGIPWFEADFDQSMLAAEARLDRLIPENKGCYTGQEVIARIRNRGHVNRLLVQVEVQGDNVPERGALILSEGSEVGWVTSAVWSYRNNAPLALGYARRNIAEAGGKVQITWGQVRAEAVVRTPLTFA